MSGPHYFLHWKNMIKSALFRYFTAATLTSLFLAACVGLSALLGPVCAPFMCPFIIGAIVGWTVGAMPALMTLLIGAVLTGYFYHLPIGRFAADPNQLLGVLLYCVMGVAAGFLGDAARRRWKE